MRTGCYRRFWCQLFFGDFTAFAKYQLYKKDGTAKTFRVLAKIAQTFPTGKTESIPAIGTGLYQTYIGLILGKITSKTGLYGDLGYNITDQGARDIFLYNFSFGLPLQSYIYGVLIGTHTYCSQNSRISISQRKDPIMLQFGV